MTLGELLASFGPRGISEPEPREKPFRAIVCQQEPGNHLFISVTWFRDALGAAFRVQ